MIRFLCAQRKNSVGGKQNSGDEDREEGKRREGGRADKTNASRLEKTPGEIYIVLGGKED